VNIERWGWYSIAVNVVLGGINLSIAVASGSLAVGAEMVHNLVDLLTAIGVLIGIKLATRKSRAFPYGLYKLENLITVALAGMILVTAYEIGRQALFNPSHEPTVNLWMLGGLLIAMAIPLVFSRFELRAGQAANSPALIADAKEYQVHVLTTGLAFFALLTQWFHFPLDRIAALVIVVVIAKTGWDLLVEGIRVLLDASLDADTLVKIREIVASEPTVAEVESVTGRNAGRFRFIEIEVTLRSSGLEKAEAATQHIERRIHESIFNVERVLIHAEPARRTHLRYAAPLADADGTLSQHFGEAPYFSLITVRRADGLLERKQIVENPHRHEEKAKGIRVSEWLVDQKVDVVLLKKSLSGKGPVYVFGDAAVEMWETEATTLSAALSEIAGQGVKTG
jgi:cation diffusion facilitator family transporter